MARKPTFDYDLIVIGSGAAGSPAATIAANAGKRVAVVEANMFGGESPNWGDIPLKAMLHATQLYDEARHAGRFGVRSSTIGYNFMSLKAWKNTAIKRTGAGNNRTYYEKQGIAIYYSLVHFLSPNEISVARRHLSAEQFLVATGSHWEQPAIAGIDEAGYHTPQTILDIPRPPKSMLIIGGDNLSVEYTQLFASLGTKVYLVEKAARILPDEDQEVGELFAKLLAEQKGVSVLTQTRLLTAQKEGLLRKVTFSRGGVEKTMKVDEILLTTGRAPTVDIGLENATVAYSPKGIEVNEHLQTSAKSIYAAGDVLGNKRYLHTALLESRVAAHNLLHKQKISPDYFGTPNVTYTFPGIASVGLREDDCIKRDLTIRTAVAPLTMVARANTSDFRDGFVKLITDKKGILLGATVIAPHAGEIIHELALAIRHHMHAADLATMPHAFLSWSEAVRVAAARLG
jgi:dihydrolipoamide dehydrogenase